MVHRASLVTSSLDQSSIRFRTVEHLLQINRRIQTLSRILHIFLTCRSIVIASIDRGCFYLDEAWLAFRLVQTRSGTRYIGAILLRRSANKHVQALSGILG